MRARGSARVGQGEPLVGTSDGTAIASAAIAGVAELALRMRMKTVHAIAREVDMQMVLCGAASQKGVSTLEKTSSSKPR